MKRVLRRRKMHNENCSVRQIRLETCVLWANEIEIDSCSEFIFFHGPWSEFPHNQRKNWNQFLANTSCIASCGMQMWRWTKSQIGLGIFRFDVRRNDWNVFTIEYWRLVACMADSSHIPYMTAMIDLFFDDWITQSRIPADYWRFPAALACKLNSIWILNVFAAFVTRQKYVAHC